MDGGHDIYQAIPKDRIGNGGASVTATGLGGWCNGWQSVPGESWPADRHVVRKATSGHECRCGAALLEFAEQLEAKPIHPEDVPAKA